MVPGPRRSSACPICGRGTLVDLAYDAGTGERGPGERPMQLADSSQVDVYSCGHEVVGASLARAAEPLDVETRGSDEPVEPPARERETRRVVEGEG
jgi:hypothetical protein